MSDVANGDLNGCLKLLGNLSDVNFSSKSEADPDKAFGEAVARKNANLTRVSPELRPKEL